MTTPDDIWARLARLEPDIQRIALHGPRPDHKGDYHLVRGVFCHIMAELCDRGPSTCGPYRGLQP